MANKSLQHSSLTDNIFYRSMLAGNDAYFPEFESDDFLEEVVLSSSASSVTFSGLASYATAGYKHLQIRAISRTDRGSFSDNVSITINGNSGANYSWHYLFSNSSSPISSGSTSQNAMSGMFTAGSTAAANAFGSLVADFLDFNNSSTNTTMRALSGYNDPANTGRIALGSGLFVNTSAVSSIAIAPRFGTNYVTGSRFSLYGSKG